MQRAQQELLLRHPELMLAWVREEAEWRGDSCQGAIEHSEYLVVSLTQR